MKKLIGSDPFSKLVPLDIFLPIMYGKYPDDAVNRHFTPRNLVALALKDYLSYPAQYWGQKLHTSDTGKMRKCENVWRDNFTLLPTIDKTTGNTIM